jgi:hypothetical protein
MSKTVICLNGPPRTGKDTIAKMFAENCIATRHCENKSALFDLVFAFSGIEPIEWFGRYGAKSQGVDVYNFGEWMKDVPWEKLPIDPKTGDHFSQRQFMIYVSEDIAKVHFGDNYFGKRSADLVKNDTENDTFVFSDGGFQVELEEMYSPDIDLIVIRLHREGHDYGNDSRSYLYPDKTKANDIDIYVEENDIESAYEEIYNYVFNY